MAKGFKNVESRSSKRTIPRNEGEVIVDINIDKNEKTKIHRIYFEGNEKPDRPGVEEGDEEDEREVQLAERLENQYHGDVQHEEVHD